MSFRTNRTRIKKLPLKKGSLFDDSWLAGFIDALGYFYIRVYKGSNNPRIGCCRFSISLIQIDGDSNLYFLEAIAEFLLTKVKLVRTKTNYPQGRVEITSLKGGTVLESYLAKFPLYTRKYLDSRDWLKVLGLLKQGEYKNQTQGGNAFSGNKPEVIEKILSIKSKMNDKRTQFNWDHLRPSGLRADSKN